MAGDGTQRDTQLSALRWVERALAAVAIESSRYARVENVVARVHAEHERSEARRIRSESQRLVLEAESLLLHRRSVTGGRHPGPQSGGCHSPRPAVVVPDYRRRTNPAE